MAMAVIIGTVVATAVVVAGVVVLARKITFCYKETIALTFSTFSADISTRPYSTCKPTTLI